MAKIMTAIGSSFGKSKSLQAFGVIPGRGVLDPRDAKDLRAFAFLAASGRLWRSIRPATGSCWMAGFGVMESPEGVSPRLAEGFQVQRLWIDCTDATDAAAPGSRKLNLW